MIHPSDSPQARHAFEISISKDELNSLPTEKFDGDIVLVNNVDDADAIINELESSPVVGFDTETKPSFTKGRLNRVALLQLATQKKSYLIRLSQIGLPESVKNYLEDDRFLKVGLSIKDDFNNLSKICSINPKGFVDLQDYVKKFKITDSSLTKINGIVFGKRISKGQQLSNWEARELTRKQMEYAALDALACVNIFQRLSSGQFVPSDSPYFRKICQEKGN